jgi:uncharacterized protein (TIRG00374 family)
MSIDPSEFREKWALRYLCLMGVAFPSLALSLLKRRAMPVVRITFAIFLMGYLIARGAIDVDAMMGAGERWPWLLIGLALIITQPVIGAIRWRWLLAAQEITLSIHESLRLTLAGAFFNTCLPGSTGGDIFRAYAIGKSESKTAEAVMTLFLDRAAGLAGLILLCAASITINLSFIESVPQLQEVVAFVLIVLSVAATIMICLLSRRMAERLRQSWLAKRHFPGRLALGRAFRALQVYHGSRLGLLAITGLSLISHIGTIGAAWCFNRALGMEGLSFAQLLLIVPLGLAVNAIPLSPGGVGQGQKAFDTLYSWSLPGVAGVGGIGGAVMTFIHIGLYLISLIGACIYAAGYHDLHDALEKAEAEVEAEEADPLAPAESLLHG